MYYFYINFYLAYDNIVKNDGNLYTLFQMKNRQIYHDIFDLNTQGSPEDYISLMYGTLVDFVWDSNQLALKARVIKFNSSEYNSNYCNGVFKYGKHLVFVAQHYFSYKVATTYYYCSELHEACKADGYELIFQGQ